MPHHEIACPSGFTFLARSFGGAEIHSVAERVSPSAAGNVIANVLHACHIETTDAGYYPETIAAVGNTKPNFRRVLFTDAWAALLTLRDKSYPKWGGQYIFDWNCGKCGELFESTASLNEIVAQTKPLPASSRETLQHRRPFESVVDGVRVQWDLPRIEHQEAMREFMNKKHIRHDSAVTQMCRQMTRLEGAKRQDLENFWKWATALPAEPLAIFVDEMSKADARVDTQVLVRCQECGAKQKIFAPLGRSFFLPPIEMGTDETHSPDSSPDFSEASTTS